MIMIYIFFIINNNKEKKVVCTFPGKKKKKENRKRKEDNELINLRSGPGVAAASSSFIVARREEDLWNLCSISSVSFFFFHLLSAAIFPLLELGRSGRGRWIWMRGYRRWKKGIISSRTSFSFSANTYVYIYLPVYSRAIPSGSGFSTLFPSNCSGA